MTVTESATPLAPGPVSSRVLTGLAPLGTFNAVRAEWRRRRRYRADLKRLLRVGPHMIDDVGLTLREARCEMAKPFWVP